MAAPAGDLRRIGAVLAAVAVAVAPVRLAWSTYLRAGPGQAFSALDEVEHDTPVQMRGCAGAWCRIAVGGVVGYVDRDAMALSRAPAGKGGARCVVAGQPGGRGLEPTRFCAPR